MKKVLILGVASVQADAIRYLKGEGYEVYACAMANDGPGAEEADYFEVINILDRESIIDFIQQNNISLVYSVGSDLAMPTSAFISEKLVLPRFVSEETAKICNNKDLMRESLGNEFEGNVKYQVLVSKEQDLELNYPFILKPTDSQGQRGVYLIESPQQFCELFDEVKSYSRSGKVIIEQYIAGPEISVNGYMVNGEIVYLRATDRETWEEYTGLIKKHIVPSRVVDNNLHKEILEITQNTCNKLKINNGPVYVQMKVENFKPYIIEITPRLDGCHMWELLKEYDGINLLKLTFEHLLNNDLNEIKKQKNSKMKNEHILEFICDKPNKKANYHNITFAKEDLITFTKYYKENQNIRPINGKYEKIGYYIYKS